MLFEEGFDATNQLLFEIEGALGDTAKRLGRTKPATKLDEYLTGIIEKLQDPRHDNTMGRISKPLIYSHFFRGKPARFHDAILRLLKGGWLLIIDVKGPPESGSNAIKDSPFATYYYNLELNPEKF